MRIWQSRYQDFDRPLYVSDMSMAAWGRSRWAWHLDDKCRQRWWGVQLQVAALRLSQKGSSDPTDTSCLAHIPTKQIESTWPRSWSSCRRCRLRQSKKHIEEIRAIDKDWMAKWPQNTRRRPILADRNQQSPDPNSTQKSVKLGGYHASASDYIHRQL